MKFSSGLVNFNSFFLTTLMGADFQIFILSLFRSIIVAGKNKSLKKSCVVLELPFNRFENFLWHRRFVELADKDTTDIFS